MNQEINTAADPQRFEPGRGQLIDLMKTAAESSEAGEVRFLGLAPQFKNLLVPAVGICTQARSPPPQSTTSRPQGTHQAESCASAR